MNGKYIAAILILLTPLAVFFLLPNDEKKIRSNLSSLAEYCSTEPQEAVMETLKKTVLTTKLCTNPCRVTIDSFKVAKDLDRKGISDRLLLMKKQLPDTHFSFHDTTVHLSNKKQATLNTTLRLNRKNVTGRFTDAYELDITTVKTEGNWLFSSFHVVEFMEK